MKPRNYPRSHTKSLQLILLGAGVRSDTARWRDGEKIDYLGGSLSLKLDTDRRHATREDGVLHLPLPPQATQRQIQDAAESWLRRDAERIFATLIVMEARRQAKPPPDVSLSFSSRNSWAEIAGQVVRINWRLIEQPLPVIELTLQRAVSMLPVEQTSADLFSAFA